MTAEELREQVFADLEARGFHPARSLPSPDVNHPIRPAAEVAARLMALDALFTWVAFSEEGASSERIANYIARSGLREWLTPDEDEIIALPRAKAYETHVDAIGWKLENMWALAWVLGFSPEPIIEASQIGTDVTNAIIDEFLPGLDGTVTELLTNAAPRQADEVIAFEYLFYCAHNAVRSAQLGRRTVPADFHPIIHGGAVHERRHALSWCVSPGVAWEDIELST